jgi:RecA/RadA recombinase|tara:strand:+ start:695 stop:1714 length:1020 start_codon:yes stop_codon:yes gene_type:complete
MSDFLKDIIKETGNEYATLVSEGVEAGDVDSFIDTGSLAFNALLSGSIYGGMPSNKITAIAGEAATGKTFFALGIVKAFLDKNKDAGVIYFESESALTKDLVESRGIDSSRMVIVPVATVQEFRHQSIKVIDKYLEQGEDKRKPLMFVLDSLGMLSTTKEMEDTAEGKETRDMTRSQIVKAAFRVLTLKLGKAKVPMIMTNHTYDVIGSMFPQKEMGGGSGLKYAASNIVYLSKRKEKDGKEIIGNIIHCKNYKSRLTKENALVDVRLTYKDGLDKYYGLLELAIKHGIFKSVSTRIELPDGSKQYAKTINNEPDKFFTKDVLTQIDEAAKKEFLYGTE